MKTATYQKYREVGIPEFCQIPAHWNVRKLKFVCSVIPSNVDKHIQDDEIPVRLCNYTDVYNRDMISDNLPFMEATATEAEISRFGLMAGDVVITKDSETWTDIAVPALVPHDMDGVVCGYHLSLIRPDSEMLEGAYLFRALSSGAINHQFRGAANGVTRFGLPVVAINGASIPVPPLDEQQAIVRFIDAKTAQIDVLIQKKEALLARLAEQRNALITQAVTKGLVPGGPMRLTDVPWLLEIPSQWEFKRLRFLLEAPLMYGANEAAEYEEPSWPRFIRITDVNSDGTLRPETFKSLPPEVAAPYMLADGDILLARSGATVGKSFKYEKSWGDAAFAGYLIRARFPTDLVDYVTWFLRSQPYWEWVRGIFIQATIQNISAEKYADLWLPVPPKTERAAIVEHLATSTVQINKMEAAIKGAIEQLTEYRAAIITAAVTGQIDVRKLIAEPEASATVIALDTKRRTTPSPFKRAVLAAEIVEALGGHSTFGRVKFQKVLHLCEAHLGIEEVAGGYRRHAAGPHDPSMMMSVESQMRKQKWFSAIQSGKGSPVSYVRMENAGGHKRYFERYWEHRQNEIRGFLKLFEKLDTERCEIVSTLYAAWNDLLIEGRTASDDDIVSEVLERWDAVKRRIREDRWRRALGWMREKGMIPRGTGPHTIVAGQTHGGR